MLKTWLLIPVVVVLLSASSAHAQRQFAGSYDLFSGYMTGQATGIFGYGTATILRNGDAAYTAYFPFTGTSGLGSGKINRKGVFALNNGTVGTATLRGNRVAVGDFYDSIGSGFFALRKR